MKKNIYPIDILLMGILLFWYVFQRAILLSLTHDESATTDLVSVALADIMFAPNQFQTANNHILHSILMKWSVTAFGWKEWSIRLPNILFFVLYYATAAWYIHQLSKNLFMRIAGVFILCTVPYLLDFFSLARGYGMANAFSLAAIVLLITYFQHAEKKYLLLSFCFAALAVYSNFTWLNIYLGLWLLLNLGTILFFRTENGKSLVNTLVNNNSYPLLISSFLALLIYKPISFLRRQDEFKWGTADWSTSFKNFINDLLYGHSFFFNRIRKLSKNNWLRADCRNHHQRFDFCQTLFALQKKCIYKFLCKSKCTVAPVIIDYYYLYHRTTAPAQYLLY